MRKLLTGLSLAFTLSAVVLGTAASTVARADGEKVNISNKPIQLQVARQDPINGQITNLALPLDKLPGPAQDLFSTPVGPSLNSFWSGTAAPSLCNYAIGALNGKGYGGFHMYDTGCSLAQGGTVTASEQGGKVVLSYYLPQNVLTTWVTTPATCAPGHGTIFCPTDPKVSLTADIELQATIAMPGSVCDAHIDPFSVHVYNVTLDSQNLTADIAFGAVDLWADLTGTDYVVMAQNLISQGVAKLNTDSVQMQQAITSKVAAFTSSLCNSIIPSLPGASDLWLLTASVDSDQGLGFRLLDLPPVPSLFHAIIKPAQPTVTAGTSLQVDGQYFPSNGGTVTLTIDGFATTPTAAPCVSSRTIICADSAPRVLVGVPTAVPCVSSRTIICADSAPRSVVLNTTLGTATVTSRGTFSTTVTIPAGMAAGSYTLSAAAGTAGATASIQVVAAGSSKGVITLVSFLGTAINSASTDSDFPLVGNGFVAGTVTISLDSATGMQLASATVGSNGTFRTTINV
ncbi:MAG: hypothetical protein M3021_10420, partial [Actinomycetota bacterium]|nr:hypothetical protein [Actinomycetota bacterium]